VAGLNATQGSLLGFLLDAPRTGWELLQEVERGLSRFWNVTPSHVYRELRTLEERGLVRAGEPGVRDRRPFTITAAGRRAFQDWLRREPGPEQIRMPLLVKLWFGQHLDPDTLDGFLEASRADHERRLRLYERVAAPDPGTAAVVAFGVAYETAVLGWLDDLRDRGAARLADARDADRPA
jgi:DNA-binding PadR family transcriptional regulator